MSARALLLKRIAIVVVATMGISLTAASQTDADPPACAPFNDPGCFFGENWEKGTVNGWAVNAGTITNVTPGLNGTSHSVQLDFIGRDGGKYADTPVSHVSPSGEVVWIEFWVQFASNFQWAAGPAGVTGLKLFEFFIKSPPPPCTGRILLTIHAANGGTNVNLGHPQWSLYPDTSLCGGTSLDTDPVIDSSINFTPGNTYHVVTELKVAPCCTGYIKTWINDQLALSRMDVQTAVNPSLGWSYVRIGGAFGDTGNSSAWYDQIRLTTTNIAPAAGGLGTPTNLRVQ
jgi:hypothetical protein